jgi:hypothetical protein
MFGKRKYFTESERHVWKKGKHLPESANHVLERKIFEIGKKSIKLDLLRINL